jgi:hypothetical protein
MGPGLRIVKDRSYQNMNLGGGRESKCKRLPEHRQITVALPTPKPLSMAIERRRRGRESAPSRLCGKS